MSNVSRAAIVILVWSAGKFSRSRSWYEAANEAAARNQSSIVVNAFFGVAMPPRYDDNLRALVSDLLNQLLCSPAFINPIHLITALCLAEVFIDRLHALPELTLLHQISVSRHFAIIFAAKQVCVHVIGFSRV